MFFSFRIESTQFSHSHFLIRNELFSPFVRELLTLFTACIYTGVLCGECDPEYGVGLLESECRKFSGVNMYYWLIPMLGEAGMEQRLVPKSSLFSHSSFVCDCCCGDDCETGCGHSVLSIGLLILHTSQSLSSTTGSAIMSPTMYVQVSSVAVSSFNEPLGLQHHGVSTPNLILKSIHHLLLLSDEVYQQFFLTLCAIRL